MLKSEIYTPKRDDEHPHPFQMRSPPRGVYLWFGKHGMLSMLGFSVAAISTLRAAVSLPLMAFSDYGGRFLRDWHATRTTSQTLKAMQWFPLVLCEIGTLFHKEILVRLHYAACLRKKGAPVVSDERRLCSQSVEVTSYCYFATM